VAVAKDCLKSCAAVAVCLGLLLSPLSATADKIGCIKFTNLADGVHYNLADYQDYQIILLFGSIYCRPCVGLLPVMNRFYEETRDLKILIVGVDVDTISEEPRIRRFVDNHSIKFPFFIDTINLSKEHKIFMLPSVLFLDGRGAIEKRIIGPKPLRVFEQELERVRLKADKKTPECPAS
jgi:thiol-disulfide isomerase/thioredoxin